jgi:putative acetyltransferase
MHIRLESPTQAEVVRLIDELDAYQKPLYPETSHHGIDPEALSQNHVLFAVVRTDDDTVVACGAVVLADGYGELKRMYVKPAVRGRGIGKALLEFLEAQALGCGCSRLALETGRLQAEALALYAGNGYVECGPFGEYAEDPHSVFMCKNLRNA